MSAEAVMTALAKRRYSLERETETQLEIAEALDAAKIPYERERRLSAKDRPDFLCEGGVVIEVKVRAQARDVHRQLVRYCAYAEVREIVLATGRVMGMPTRIGGRPVKVFSLSRSAL